MKTLLALVMVLGFSATANASCRDGDTQRWPSNNPALQNGSEGGVSADVLWTCVNGKYVEEYKMPAPKYRGCVEGDVQRYPSRENINGSEGGPSEELFVCKNGKYTEMYKSARRSARSGRGYVCKNGSQMRFEENSTEGTDGIVSVLYTCKAGRFVRN